MPELPEVEIMTRNLRAWLDGRVLTRVGFADPTVLQGELASSAFVGRSVDRVFRRAKYSCIQVGERTLVLHFRMTGKVIRWPWSPGRHRIRMDLEASGIRVGLSDTRRLAEVWDLPSDQVGAFFSDRKLGPDAWPEERGGAWWAQQYARKRCAIKPALLDQSCVAGIGNIAASEVCWRTQVDPRRLCSSLSGGEWSALARHTVAFMGETIEAETADEIVYVTAGGANPFAIYGRSGEPCPRCARPLSRTTQAGRASFYCPGCQH
jgi:formamidopyrimidine-DNA glycosylase